MRDCIRNSMRAVRGVAALAVAISVFGCGDSDPNLSTAPSAPSLSALHATRGASAGVYDAKGRQVLLRGVNVNALGDYFQGNPKYPQVLPVDDSHFVQMARYGFNVVRLIVSWSSLEPQRDQISTEYLQRIHTIVDLAKAHDIYVVLDMHQDAWGKYIATPPDVSCPGGREVAIGWDGAPEWATYTDGASTCRPPGQRELAPAVKAAFVNFYANREGIQDQFVKAWAALAREFAKEPTVAGYDLLNEPHFGSSVVNSGPQLLPLYEKLFPALRAAELDGGGFAHIVFFEPIVLYPSVDALPPPESVNDDNTVFAPHNYAESLNDVTTIEGWFDRATQDVGQFQTTFWVGEYGWFGDPPANKPRLIRYAQQEDQHRIGSTWWQWQQACGDPHSIGIPGHEPPPQLIHFRLSTCPGDVDLGPIPEWTVVLSRSYPRAAPGRLLALESDGDARTMRLQGVTADGAASSTLDLWVPDNSKGQPQISGLGLGKTSIRAVLGGYRCQVEVSGTYEVDVK